MCTKYVMVENFLCESLYRESSAHLSDWVKKPRHFLHQSKVKRKKIDCLARFFPRCEFPLICDWFVCLTARVKIGH